MGLPGGILLDKGYYRITLAIGSLLYVFSYVFYFFPQLPLLPQCRRRHHPLVLEHMQSRLADVGNWGILRLHRTLLYSRARVTETLHGVSPRHAHVATTVASRHLCLRLFMVSIADRSKYYQLYLSQGLGMGIGAGLIYVPTMALQGQHWRARRALAMGVVVCGMFVHLVGHAIAPTLPHRFLCWRHHFSHHAQPALPRQHRFRVGRASERFHCTCPPTGKQPPLVPR